MSTDWGIGCRTCHAAGKPRKEHFTGEWDNCRNVDALRRLIAARVEILAVTRVLDGQVAFFWHPDPYASMSNAAYDVAAFFETHVGHDLGPMDEYGRFDDQCGEYVTCKSCSATHDCALTRGHDGDHAPGPRRW